MTIAQIVPSLAAQHGGPSRSVRGLSSALAGAGHSVELLTTGADSEAQPDASGLSVQAFPRDRPQMLGRSSALETHLLSRSYDIVHHHALWLRTLHHARLAAQKSNAPLVISPRGMMSGWAWRHHRYRKQCASWVVHPGAFRRAAGWHATSEAEADDIRRLGFTQPICVSPNAVTPPPVSEIQAEAAYWRAELPEINGRRVALFYSRFHEKKRVVELIDLWLSKKRDGWVLLVVGIPEQYGVAQLERHLAKYPDGNARVLVRDGSARPPPYAISSLFLLPSHSENFGLVVAEALVRGVPALVTDTTPWRALEQHACGRCVSWDVYGAGLDALIAESSASLAEMGQNANAWSRAEFSWEKSARLLLGFYDRLVAGK